MEDRAGEIEDPAEVAGLAGFEPPHDRGRNGVLRNNGHVSGTYFRS
jgi:hypothetical protein